MFKLVRIMSSSGLSAASSREVALLTSQLTNIRAEIRHFMEEKTKQIDDIQQRIKSLQPASKRSVSPVPEANNKRIKTEGERLDFTVTDGFTEVKLGEIKDNVCTKFTTQVYTDGACPNNGRGAAKAGIGVWWGEDHRLNLARRVAGDKQTNNVAEIQAATMALTQAHSAGRQKVEVKTDSQFVINCITKWVANWKKNGWKTAAGKPVINKEDLIELDRAVDTVGRENVKWTYVKGHSDNYGNNQADKLAVAGANM